MQNTMVKEGGMVRMHNIYPLKNMLPNDGKIDELNFLDFDYLKRSS